MQLNSIWSVSSKHEDGLETIHNHQTQDQRVRTFLKSASAGHGIFTSAVHDRVFSI